LVPMSGWIARKRVFMVFLTGNLHRISSNVS
jgi:hypothetical protein